ncbi:MAG: DNA translocase FtsK 4TM domain-containing protein [Spirochaetia bacterium]|nr:DNA translocase FtsK 4TM domain-containing protein [Spirochaetia bacterium]
MSSQPPIPGERPVFQHKPLVLGAAFLVPGTLVLLSLLSLSIAFAKTGSENAHDNWIGFAGHFIALVLLSSLGNAAFLFTVGVMALGAGAIVREGLPAPHLRILGMGIITLASTVLLSYFGGGSGSFDGGGLVGRGLGAVLGLTFGGAGGFIVAATGIIIGLVLAVDAPIGTLWALFTDRARMLGALLPAGETTSGAEPQPSAGETPRAPLARVPSESPQAHWKPALVEQHMEDSMKPWFERMPPDEDTSAASQPGPLPPYAEATSARVDAEQPRTSPVGELAAALQSLNARMNTRHRPAYAATREPVTQSRGPGKSGPFEGFFTDNEQRFVFGNSERNFVSQPVRADITSGPLLRPLNLEIVPSDYRALRERPAPVTPIEDYSADLAEDSLSQTMPAPAVSAPTKVSEVAGDLLEDIEAENQSDELVAAGQVETDEETAFLSEGETEEPQDSQENNESAWDTDESEDEHEAAADREEGGQKQARRRTETGVPAVVVKGRYALSLEILNMSARDPLAMNDTTRETDETKTRLERVLSEYGIQAKVVGQQRGPIITNFEVKLDSGVRVAKIAGLYDEIKMNLETPSLRIVAPIPGRNTIGIEIPNKQRDTVLLGDLARRDPGFFSKNRELSIVLGKDISGANVYIDLARLPHLLIAGATGAGKSVYLNAVIASLLYTRSPEDMRFIMIDPKMVELNLYEGIPHLLMPVITDVSKAGRALAWVVDEMERRYAFLSQERCRDIRGYNARIQPGLFSSADMRKMPYIVVCIDELSDLMLVAPREVETYIMRLSQKARAVGIHMIMATQRPSVDVISPIIKANAPARIAFHVAQKTDSRTILESNGADTLLDRGDMLYKSPSSTTLARFHAPLITEGEIEKIVAETLRFGKPEYVELPGGDDGAGMEDEDNDVDPALFQEAWELVVESGKTSTSYLQRRLKIGYNRAANIIEMMEAKGYLGPALGNKPREILKRS